MKKKLTRCTNPKYNLRISAQEHLDWAKLMQPCRFHQPSATQVIELERKVISSYNMWVVKLHYLGIEVREDYNTIYFAQKLAKKVIECLVDHLMTLIVWNCISELQIISILYSPNPVYFWKFQRDVHYAIQNDKITLFSFPRLQVASQESHERKLNKLQHATCGGMLVISK